MKDHQFETLLALMKEHKEDSNKQRQEDKLDSNQRFEQLSHEMKKNKEDVNQRFTDIANYMKDFKYDVNRRFEQVDRRFDETSENFKELKKDIREDKDKLQQVYESRDRVTVHFTRIWAMASLFIAFLASSLSIVFSVIT